MFHSQRWFLFEGNLELAFYVKVSASQKITQILFEEGDREMTLETFLLNDKRMENLAVRGKSKKIGNFLLKCIKKFNVPKSILKNKLEKNLHL
jgi:hypothetical protein